MSSIKDIIREEIKNLIQDDALFRKRSMLGLEDEVDIPGDSDDDYITSDEDLGADHNSELDKHEKKSSYMSKPQLFRITKQASEIFNMLEDNEEIEDWMESYISQASQMMQAVYGKLEYKKSQSYHKKHLGPIIQNEE